jgi:hypothetical protein
MQGLFEIQEISMILSLFYATMLKLSIRSGADSNIERLALSGRCLKL